MFPANTISKFLSSLAGNVLKTTFVGAFYACFLFYGEASRAQEIHFADYYKYTVELDDLTPAEDLEFGFLIIDEGSVGININNAKVLSITGVKYLDVLVDVTADDYLLLDGNPSNAGNASKRIPFTLQAAYANRGTDNPAHGIPFQISSNYGTARFRIRDRGNQPPGPPPTPVHEGYNPAVYNDTAYLYIYGSANVGTIDAGSYKANINISISYD